MKRARWGIALVLAVLGSTVLAPSSALADRSQCPPQELCLWDGPTYGGGRVDYHLNNWTNMSGFDNIASSVYNNTNRWAIVAAGWNGGEGWIACLGPGGYTSFNTGGFPPIDNTASSVWLGTSNPGC
jgi:hypothetical protein